jgi:hypothetical protein
MRRKSPTVSTEIQPPSRRSFLAGTAAIVAGLPARLRGVGESGSAGVAGGHRAYRMAMHVHASFSEGRASMHAQADEATANGLDVIWWTEHDWRMSAHGYRTLVSFDSLTAESEAGRPWNWQPQKLGAPAGTAGGIVPAPLSPDDPSQIGALHVMCAAPSGTQSVSYRFYANAGGARRNQRANLVGQTVSIDVYPKTVGPDGWLELLVSIANRPAVGGRPPGGYQLSYRFGTAPASRSRDPSSSLIGVVTVPLGVGSYHTVALDPVADIAAIWPDLVSPGDNGLYDLWLGATARSGATAEGFFDHLVFDRSRTAADQPLAIQAGFMTALGPLYPQIVQYAADEVSYFEQHINVFGGGSQHLYDYSAYPNVESGTPNFAFGTMISDLAHRSGGLTAINHPFGPQGKPVSPTLDQNPKRRKITANLLKWQAVHADIVEVGLRQRGTATLETHLSLGDALWRNGLWLCATGVNDDHGGDHGGWARDPNRFFTSAWASSLAEPDLLSSLRAGQVFVTELGTWSGNADLSVDGVVPMGAVSVRPTLSSRTLAITAGTLPAGSSAEVVQGPVDYGGAADPEPRSKVIATLPAAAFAAGPASVDIDTGTSSFVRVAFLAADGHRFAFTNPIWLLHEPARTPVPSARISPDSA